MAAQNSRLKRLAWRIPFAVLRGVVALIGCIHARPYMVAYVFVLRCFGMKLRGTPRFIASSAYFDDIDKITLGDRVVISTEVTFLTHDYALTTALIACGEMPSTDIARVLPITVGNNVFIGHRSVVLPNTRIGDNVIVGAGSVVRGNIPDNSIYVGSPGCVIGTVTEYGEKCKEIVASGEIRCD